MNNDFLNFSCHTIEKDLNSIANNLFNQCVFKVNSTNFRFTEIEFYVYNKMIHPDEYTHKNILQSQTGMWYFHGSGLDYTFGNQETFASFLIRGIINSENQEEIYGPLKIVSELFKQTSNNQNILELNIESKVWDELENVLQATRIGLNKEKCNEYFLKNYRFLIYPKLTHKSKLEIAETNKMLLKDVYK